MVQDWAMAAAAIGFLAWRALRFRAVKRALPELRRRGAVVVDVRTAAEFRGGSSAGSVNIPLAELEENLARLDPAKPVVVCCASGARSAAARAILKRHGFRDVVNAGPWRNTAV